MIGQVRLDRRVPSEDAPLVVFDLDGTICHTPPGVDFMRASSVGKACRPNPLVVDRIRALWDSETCHIAVLTARNRSRLGGVTRAQLALWLGDDVEDGLYNVWDSGIGSMDEIGPKRFWRAVTEFKAFHLSNHQATVFIGDTHSDLEAARLAGVPFMSAYEFGRGALIPGLQGSNQAVRDA